MQDSDRLPTSAGSGEQINRINLADLLILALDCQATGAGPAKGHLLEIGWVTSRAADGADPQILPAESVFVRLPRKGEIPPAVQRVTGLSKTSLKKALPISDIWNNIVDIARKIAAINGQQRCPTVIHYARFEEPFLRRLHTDNKRTSVFPFCIICSHEIARRLLPGLPRKGLRAVAGYFGHSVPQLRRSADHVVATAVIWRHLVQRLEAEHGIQYLDQLSDWLNRIAPPCRPVREYPMKPEVRLDLPDGPGIYRMRRSNGDLLYIGKAKSLKNRVNSYFRQKGVRAEHTLEMLSQAADLDVTQTDSALEAAVLESDEIKRLAPPYNIALQKGERRLVFFSGDLQKCTATPGSVHCVGPLPNGSLTQAMLAFGWLHESGFFTDGGELLNIGGAILGVTEADVPPRECLAEGLGQFRRHHRIRLNHPSALRTLTAVGKSLWRERLVALSKARAETTQEEIENAIAEEEVESHKEPIWTPETVARRVENAAMHSALLIRRSRWMCLLSESALSWEVRGSRGRRKHVLLLENGVASRCDSLPMGEKSPAPPGYARSMPERQKVFNLTTYERLRVVTTELRRLAAEGREVEIRLKPNSALNRRQLARILPWV